MYTDTKCDCGDYADGIFDDGLLEPSCSYHLAHEAAVKAMHHLIRELDWFQVGAFDRMREVVEQIETSDVLEELMMFRGRRCQGQENPGRRKRYEEPDV